MYNNNMKSSNLIKMLFSIFCLTPLSASDTESNVIFKGLSYPFEIKVKSSEKDAVLYETPVSNALTGKYNLVVIQGETGCLDISISLKMVNDDETATEISPETMKIYKNGRFWARFKTKVPGTKPFKITFRGISATPEFKITVYEVQSLYELTKQKAEYNYIPDPSMSVPDTLNVIKRAQWKAAPPKEPYVEHIPRAITIHHTSGKLTKTLDESISEIQFIQDYHQNAKGWNDIGYHFLVDPMGNIFEGRPLKVVGAHVYLKNTNNIGISLMGNYHPSKNDIPSPEALKAISFIASYVTDTYSVQKSSFYAHRDIGATDCPGDILYAKIPELKKEIFERPSIDLDISTSAYLVEKLLPDTFFKEVFKRKH